MSWGLDSYWFLVLCRCVSGFVADVVRSTDMARGPIPTGRGAESEELRSDEQAKEGPPILAPWPVAKMVT